MAAVTEVGHGAAELYERHSHRVFGYCLSKLGGREDAEDATQLTFLHAVRGLRRGVVPAAESAWLLAIARNVCLSRWASASRRNRVESACDPAELEQLTSAPDPRRDELIGLERALELLPEQQRRAVLLRDWRGLSYEEVAAQLGVSQAAVETLIFRGRAALADRLSEQAGEPRRRLLSLAGLGSFVNSVKGAFTGAAAGAKLAAGVAAVIAVSGGGVALGTAVVRAPAEPPARSVAEPAQLVPVGRTAATPVTESTADPAVPAPTGAPPVRAAPDRTADGPADDPSAAAAPPATPGAAPMPEPGDATPVAPVPAPVVEKSSPASPAAETPPVDAPVPDLPAADLPAADLPAVDLPAVDLPAVDVPLLPPIDVPSTGAVVAAAEPVTAAVDETLDSVPPLPVVPLLPPPPPVDVPLLP